MSCFRQCLLIVAMIAAATSIIPSHAWAPSSVSRTRTTTRRAAAAVALFLSSSTQDSAKTSETPETWDYRVPEDAVVVIKPSAMKRLRELRDQQQANPLILRMGVRSGGCSGMSYVMDFATPDAILEDDAIDVYDDENVQCVVDAKSMLYLYGLELDYSDQLIGGGFKFYNPNAEESCGCGSSFGV